MQPNFDDDDTASTGPKSTTAARKPVKGRKSLGLYPHNRSKTHDASGSMFPNLAKRATRNIPKPDARANQSKIPGSRSAPWLRLTASEIEELEVRQRQELAQQHINKAADWKPNSQAQEAELARLGRGRAAMEAAAKLAQETGVDFLDEEAVMRADSTDNEAPDEDLMWEGDECDGGGSDITMRDAGDIGRITQISISSTEDNNAYERKTGKEVPNRAGERTSDGSKKIASSSVKENGAPRRDPGRLKKNEIPQIVWKVGRHGRGHVEGEVVYKKGHKKYSDQKS